ncbi:unnamed protein product [Callosobruchus maculatus]|uniref:RRM domain-containing protein n=1 Tax=Callosobruchus maculatus TaxID=64391 RepID=A0A653BJN2_CALMS|nr:unnamed protein product [Callosobruchus maculatus]
MFASQLGSFPFASNKIFKEEISNSSADMSVHNGAGDNNQNVPDKTKLIVNYIPQFATEDDLAQIFTPIGRVESIKIMRDYKTGYSFGFGFVKYTTPEEAAKAIEALNGFTFRYSRGEEAQAAIANLDGKMLENAILPLSVKVAEDHGRQKAQYLECWNPLLFNRGKKRRLY